MKKKIVIKPRILIYFFSSLLLIQPPYLNMISFVDNYFYDLFVPIIFVVLILKTFLKRYWNKMLLLIFLFYSIISLSTLINGGDLPNILRTFLQVFSLCLFINYGVKRDGITFIEVVGKVFFIYSLLNLFSIFFFPKGLYGFDSIEHSWFLGHKNMMIKFLMPGMLFVVSQDIINKNKLSLKSIFYIAIVYVSIMLTKSSTSIVVLFIFFMCFFFLSKKKDIISITNFNGSIVLNILFFIFFVIYRFQDKFSYIIEVVLKKNLNFTGRTSLWNNIIKYIMEKPFLGYGVSDIDVMLNRLQYTNVSSHNLVADYLYEGGIICIIILGFIIISAYQKLSQYKSINNLLVNFINILFFSFSFVFLTESFVGINFGFILCIIVFCYNISFLSKKI